MMLFNVLSDGISFSMSNVSPHPPKDRFFSTAMGPLFFILKNCRGMSQLGLLILLCCSMQHSRIDRNIYLISLRVCCMTFCDASPTLVHEWTWLLLEVLGAPKALSNVILSSCTSIPAHSSGIDDGSFVGCLEVSDPDVL